MREIRRNTNPTRVNKLHREESTAVPDPISAARLIIINQVQCYCTITDKATYAIKAWLSMSKTLVESFKPWRRDRVLIVERSGSHALLGPS